MNKIYTILFLSLFFSSWSNAQIFTEDFDGSNTSATTTTSGCDVGDNDDYFGITDETVINQDYTGDNGSFLGAQDTDGAGCTGTGAGSVSASIAGIDISGQTGLVLCFTIAEGTAGDGAEDWDASSNVTISVNIDGGAEETLFVAEASGAGNTAPGVDCDGNGTGDDGPAITEVFTEYCIDISGTGLSLDININISGLDAGDEDVALDDFTVYSNEDAGVPTGADPCPECDVTLDTESYTCISNTIGDNNDMVTVNIPYIGVDAGITSVTTTSGGTVAGDNPASITDGTIMITGLMEGDSWDIVLNGGDCDGVSVSGTIPAAECEPACMDPVASGSCSMDIQMDLASTAEAEAAPTSFHNTIMDCPAGFEYTAAYGEVADEGDGNNSTGNINGLFDESGNSIAATYTVGHVDMSCSGNGLTNTLTGGSISTGSTMQAASPKPTNLFSTHYTENTGLGGLNALKIDFATPVDNFGIFLGDWESSSQGLLGEIWAFDAGNNLICNDVMDPVLYGPIADESGCGANQGEMNCGNETTTWIGITNTSTPISCVLLVLGDDDSCAETSACDGETEHISFGGVTVGGECSEILPIELLSINAISKRNKIDLEWSTSSEINNDYFDIQWSRNGTDFQTIEKIKGSGTSYSRNDYAYTHLSPGNGKNYYRIKQVDFDGQSSYTETVLATIDNKNKIRVFPTVVNDQIKISLSEKEGSLTIYNINGTLVKSMVVNTNNLIILNVDDLTAGSYIVSFKNNQQIINERFIKL